MTGPGDPGSLSVTGGLLLRLAAGLRTDASRTSSAYAGLQGEWVGRASVAARRRGDLLVASVSTVAEETARVGALLQGHSTDLSGLLDEEAAIRTRAVAAGFVVTEVGMSLAPGLRGVADPAAVALADAERAALDLAWQDIQHRLATARASLRRELTASADRLASAATTLRTR